MTSTTRTRCRNCDRPNAHKLCKSCVASAELAPAGLTLDQAKADKDAAYWRFSRGTSSAGLDSDPALIYSRVKARHTQQRLQTA